MRVVVATSGWMYAHWGGPFSPHDLPKARRFEHSARRFRSVEVNNTFSRMPDPATIRTWRDRAPEGFPYAFTAHRHVTHLKRLRGPARPVRDLMDRPRPLGEKPGPVLPPNMPRDLDRLRGLLRALPRGEAQYVVEFRHASWHARAIFDLLGEFGVGLCIHDLGLRTPHEATATPVYVRFHGTEAPYRGEYGQRRLKPWAERMARWSRTGHDVYACFNNDEEAMAILDAEELGDQVERLTGARVLAA